MTGKWPLVPISNVCDIRNGGTPDTKNELCWDGDHAWVTPAEMGKLQSPYLGETRRKLTDAGLASCTAQLLPPRSVILSSRAPIGHLVINEVPMATNQGCKGLIPSPALDYKYLYYFLAASRDLLNELGSGTTFAELSMTRLKEVQIPLPPFDEQKRIVAKLDEAMDCVDEVRVVSKSIVNLQLDYLNSLFHENFSRSQELPVTTLAQVCQIRTGKKDVNQGNKDGEYPFFSCAKIPSRSDEYSFDTEAILLAGNGVNIGQAVYYNGKFEVYQRTYVLSDFQGIDVHYLSTILDFRLRTYLRELSMGNTIPYIKMGMLQDFPIPLPSLDDQKIIVKKLTSTFNELDRLKTNVETRQTIYKQLISGMLSSAFAGQL